VDPLEFADITIDISLRSFIHFFNWLLYFLFYTASLLARRKISKEKRKKKNA